MAPKGRTELEVGADGVAVITIVNPPVNSLSIDVLHSLKESYEEALRRNDVKAIVVTGKGGKFSGGFDITSFSDVQGGQMMQPKVGYISIDIVTDTLEAATKPSVAAIDGLALGGGLEIAMVISFFVYVINIHISSVITSNNFTYSIRHAMLAFQLQRLNCRSGIAAIGCGGVVFEAVTFLDGKGGAMTAVSAAQSGLSMATAAIPVMFELDGRLAPSSNPTSKQVLFGPILGCLLGAFGSNPTSVWLHSNTRTVDLADPTMSPAEQRGVPAQLLRRIPTRKRIIRTVA